ncbi:MAG: glycoside hydrolase family 30 beta sandwich domain-containing protein [Pseudomonadota bacterium]
MNVWSLGRVAIASAVGALLLAACSTAPNTAAQVWMTSGDRTRVLSEQPDLTFSNGSSRPYRPTVTVDPSQRYQTMVGFGASITDASAWLIQTRLTPSARDALLQELFGRRAGGLGFSLTRVTVGASDFSLDHYSLADKPDPTLANFSSARMQEFVFPTVRRALALNPDLKVMASPWSAPAWMKTSGSLIQGQLKPEFYSTYAEYWLRYIRSAAEHGVPTDYLSIQNEPDFEPDSYPGMRWGPEGRAAFIGGHLGPALADAKLDAEILDWDHNWDKPEQPLGVLADTVAAPYISGVAWHCYAGDVSTQGLVRAAHPDKDVFFTECSGGEWSADFSESFRWMMKNLIIGSTEQWARGVLMWNLALDETHGPHSGGCGDCRGVVTINTQTGAIERNQEYYAFGHASRFVMPGAVRIASVEPKGLHGVAFVNPDGQRVLILLNDGGEPVVFNIVDGDRQAPAELPAFTAATYVWSPPPK